jgi:hypothetical protein
MIIPSSRASRCVRSRRSSIVARARRGSGTEARAAATRRPESAPRGEGSSLCDPTTGDQDPAYLASVCVKPWKDGADNGATYQGVTKTRSRSWCTSTGRPQKNPPPAVSPAEPVDGKPGTIQDAILDAQQALDGRYQLWGRKIAYRSSPTPAPTSRARADAVTVAAMKPFAVVDSGPRCSPPRSPSARS